MSSYEGKAFYAMLGLVSGGVLNIFGDALFMRYYQMGIAGAGLSTTLSQYISWFILLLPYIQGKTQSHVAWKYFKPRYAVLKDIVTVGSPSLARQGLSSIAVSVLNLCAGVYGDAAIAALSIVSRICNMLFCVATGIGQGFQPVSAYNYGAKKYSRVKDGFFAAFYLGPILMFLLGLVTFLNAKSLVTLFRDDSEVIAIGTRALRYQAIALWLLPATMYGNMLFQSIGVAKTALLLACLRNGILFIPIVLLLSHFFGLPGIEVSQALTDVLCSLISILFIVSFMRNLPDENSEV